MPSASSAIPFLAHWALDAVVARRGADAIDLRRFLADAGRLAAALPESTHLLNLCADRYRFAVGLCAALLRGQVTLLPPGVAPALLLELSQGYRGLYALVDAEVPECPLPVCEFEPAVSAGRPLPAVPQFPAAQTAVIAFTSGSTGRPRPHPKRWGSLAIGAEAEAAALGLHGERPVTLVGTVPSQHMYGLESSVMLGLRNGYALYAARPFYPADIRAALESIPPPRALVTTPVHLRALLAEEQRLPPLRLILSATAPLQPELAAQAEQRYDAPLMEIYGFTEAGQVAARRTTAGPVWRTLPGVRVRVDDQGAWFGGGPIQDEALAGDVVEAADEASFTLHGRSADLVNIAGKRASLAYLTQQLLEIEGVHDGCYFAPDETDAARAVGQGHVERLIAFAVAPQLTRAALLAALRQRVDPVFLPRPLYLVDTLPRNATGKLTRESLVDLVRRLRKPKGAAGQ
jgi:acyl-coenzyme A synthetase/AMP-(fatty) acid ligase